MRSSMGVPTIMVRRPFDEVSWASLVCYIMGAALFVGACVCIHCDRKAGLFVPGFRKDVRPEQQP
jgi:hypothetical protein